MKLSYQLGYGEVLAVWSLGISSGGWVGLV